MTSAQIPYGISLPYGVSLPTQISAFTQGDKVWFAVCSRNGTSYFDESEVPQMVEIIKQKTAKEQE